MVNGKLHHVQMALHALLSLLSIRPVHLLHAIPKPMLSLEWMLQACLVVSRDRMVQQTLAPATGQLLTMVALKTQWVGMVMTTDRIHVMVGMDLHQVQQPRPATALRPPPLQHIKWPTPHLACPPVVLPRPLHPLGQLMPHKHKLSQSSISAPTLPLLPHPPRVWIPQRLHL